MASGKLILLALLGLVVAEGSVFLAAAQTFGLPLFCLRCSQLLGIWSLAAAWAKLSSSSGHVVAARIAIVETGSSPPAACWISTAENGDIRNTQMTDGNQPDEPAP